jgi:hypothetical protein
VHLPQASYVKLEKVLAENTFCIIVISFRHLHVLLFYDYMFVLPFEYPLCRHLFLCFAAPSLEEVFESMVAITSLLYGEEVRFAVLLRRLLVLLPSDFLWVSVINFFL